MPVLFLTSGPLSVHACLSVRLSLCPSSPSVRPSAVSVPLPFDLAVYRRLDIDKRLTLCGESFYNDKIPAVIEEMRAKGLLETSEGALICKVPGEEVSQLAADDRGRLTVGVQAA